MICEYCGEEEGTEKIVNPNMEELEEKYWWIVCKTCKEVIEQQKKLTFGIILENIEEGTGKQYANKYINEAQEKLEEISKKTGKTIMTAGIHKQPDGHYESVSITYKGDKNAEM